MECAWNVVRVYWYCAGEMRAVFELQRKFQKYTNLSRSESSQAPSLDKVRRNAITVSMPPHALIRVVCRVPCVACCVLRVCDV